MNREQQALLHLNLIPEIGPGTIAHLIHARNSNGYTLDNIHQASIAELRALGLSEKQAYSVYAGLQDQHRLAKECELIERSSTQLIFVTDEHYPSLLKNTHAPPPVLYCRGNASCITTNTIAIIGSRHGNDYGKRFIHHVMPELADYGWTIVSGGARGIDAIAHTAAIATKAPTIVILGSGLLQPYPPEHQPLFERVIAQGGCLMSPFSLNTRPDKWHFPARNRIIAGLSRSTIIVQAAINSGTRSTAQFALEYGRDVAVVPGAFDDLLAAGCHALADQGARLVRSAHDILIELDQSYQKKYYAEQQQKMLNKQSTKKNTTEPVTSNSGQQTIHIGKRIITEVPSTAPLCMRILSLCQTGTTVDELVEHLKLSPAQIHKELFTLQLEGSIIQDFAGIFHSTSNCQH